jgi:hypothetical protein
LLHSEVFRHIELAIARHIARPVHDQRERIERVASAGTQRRTLDDRGIWEQRLLVVGIVVRGRVILVDAVAWGAAKRALHEVIGGSRRNAVDEVDEDLDRSTWPRGARSVNPGR